MYDDNPTINSLTKVINESKQGEVYAPEGEDKVYDKYYYIESYGCAMNFSDSEIVASILSDNGYGSTRDMAQADLILVNTCSIREKAEETVRKRLRVYNTYKKKKKGLLIGVLGCMAERLKSKFLEQEKLVDIVLGPDAYRDLPNLLTSAEEGERGVNVLLSREETYADISPVRLGNNGVSGFISIMRGCDNMCSFCVVPFTRGRERSRDPFSIVAEAEQMRVEGFKEITLLGQNVDSYKWTNPETQENVSFADLLVMVAKVDSKIRVRFSTSHPKDIDDEVLFAIRDYHNICDYIHLPVQSGSSRILELMNRKYTREWYMKKIKRINEVIPECTVSSDIIAGFCTETEEDHQQTLSIIEESGFIMSYMYTYSERPGTLAARKYKDDVPHDIKKRRLTEIIKVQAASSAASNKKDLHKTFEVLIEGDSKKSKADFRGRTSHFKVIVFPKIEGYKPGDYAMVHVDNMTSGTLLGNIVTT
jgi:tRNA-2-methylthio-N6-dimethylallyladenosine synthase